MDCNIYITISQNNEDERLKIVVDRQYKDGRTTHHVHYTLSQIHSYVYRRLPKILDKATSVTYDKGNGGTRGRGWATQYFFKSKKKINPKFPPMKTDD